MFEPHKPLGGPDPKFSASLLVLMGLSYTARDLLADRINWYFLSASIAMLGIGLNFLFRAYRKPPVKPGNELNEK